MNLPLYYELGLSISESLRSLYQVDISAEQITLEKTKKEFEGNLTLVVFPFVKWAKKSPEQTAEDLGQYLLQNCPIVSEYQVIKGFLNLTIADTYWSAFLQKNSMTPSFGYSQTGNQQKVMVEYSSPNTNKPLHLGHVRNNLLGYSIAELFKSCGYDVVKANLINDRGIHICKSMLAWQKYGQGETPESSGIKGDHLVGKYYVLFDQYYRKELADLTEKGLTKEEAEKQSKLMQEAREMLIKWEQHDAETLQLWKRMNDWVYRGFETTYKELGVDFDHMYYESETYTLGKDMVTEGLQQELFYRKEDGSVWIDLSSEKLDEKLLLRSDGTSVYMTQDLGTADLKFKDHQIQKSVYVVGNEQDYHFQVLFSILRKMKRPYANGLFHLSYGMVDLPGGKMKSREGTVVDADDLIREIKQTAAQKSEELGKTEGMSETEKQELYRMIGMAALKFYILKVDPGKRMLFNPEESIDFNGDTGPFIQYTYARIQSLLNRSQPDVHLHTPEHSEWHATEKELLFHLYHFPYEVEKACNTYNPSVVAHFALQMAKSFNRVYKEVTFLREEDDVKRNNRLKLAYMTGHCIKNAMKMLGIDVPERM